MPPELNAGVGPVIRGGGGGMASTDTAAVDKHSYLSCLDNILHQSHYKLGVPNPAVVVVAVPMGRTLQSYIWNKSCNHTHILRPRGESCNYTDKEHVSHSKMAAISGASWVMPAALTKAVMWSPPPPSSLMR